MHPNIVAKKIIEFNKSNFDNTFDAITILLEHTEKMVGLFLEQSTLFPKDGKDLILEWLKTYKKGRNDFKDSVDRNFKNVENLFACGSEPAAFAQSAPLCSPAAKETLTKDGAADSQKPAREDDGETKKKKDVSGRRKTAKKRPSDKKT